MIDPAIAGKTLDTVRFPVDRSKLAELARAFGDADPAWWDPQAAADAGFDRLPVPPTATVLVDHWREGGALSAATAIGADLDRLLHGEASWELVRPVRAGEELTARASVTDVTTREGKRGGTMTVVTMETEFVDDAGDVVVRRRDTLIETGATR
jgi:acyl dehydratase